MTKDYGTDTDLAIATDLFDGLTVLEAVPVNCPRDRAHLSHRTKTNSNKTQLAWPIHIQQSRRKPTQHVWPF
jgi:hypothetical protein